MADKSQIEWTEATWNPIAGCSVVSPGCTNCYAMRRVAPRLSANPATPHYAGTVQPSKAGPVWTGKIGIAADSVLLKPLSWRRPRMIFVNSTSDLFHESVPDEVIDRIFAVMALCPQHTFQVLTKRAKRMRQYLGGRDKRSRPRCDVVEIVGMNMLMDGTVAQARAVTWPLPNVWLGVSVEDQTRADERIPELLATPAAVRFISAEPLLGPIDLTRIDVGAWLNGYSGRTTTENDPEMKWPLLSPFKHWPSGYEAPGLDWVIVGGESGDCARPMHPDWARSLRDQCAAAGVSFFFKQWGEWAPGESAGFGQVRTEKGAWYFDGTWRHRDVTVRESEAMHRDDEPDLWRLGKHAAGRLLDGVEHNGMPRGAHASA